MAGPAKGEGGAPLKLLQPVTVKEYSRELEADVEVTKPLGEVFCDLLEIGHDPEDVCDDLGVSVRSYYLWRNAGMDAASVLSEGGRDLTDNEEVYLHFLQASTRARGALKRSLERRIKDLVPHMEAREATDVLARLAKIKWSKASTMKLDIGGELSVVEHHGQAVGKLIRLVVDGLVAAAPGAKAKEAIREAAPGVVNAALAEVVESSGVEAPSDRAGTI